MEELEDKKNEEAGTRLNFTLYIGRFITGIYSNS